MTWKGRGKSFGAGVVGSVALPAGVTLQDPDGGTAFYATGYNNGVTQVPFSKATAFPTSITYMPSTVSKTVNYTNGWDDPKFFPAGGWLAYAHTTTDRDMYLDLNWNTRFACYSNSITSFSEAAGISMLVASADLFTGGTGGLIAQNSGVLSPCVVGLLTQDEPPTESAMSAPIGGTPSGGCGTFGTNCLSNTVQDSRFWWTNMLQNALIDGKTGGVVISPHMYIKQYLTPNGTTTRNPCDLTGVDAYTAHAARRPEYWGQVISNLVDATAAYTSAEIARGTHQGLFIDYVRIGYPATAGDYPRRPLFIALATGNVKGNVPYDQGHHELNWEVWAIVIHGARGLFFFDVDDSVGWYGVNCPQEGFFAFSATKVQQTATFTGTISGTGTGNLTVTGMVSNHTTNNGHIQCGMEIVSGAGGPPYPIIQLQETFANEATFSGATTYASNNDDTVIAISSVTGSIPVPAILDARTASFTGPSFAAADTALWDQTSGTAGQAGNYKTNRQGIISASTSATGLKAYCPGLNGTYTVSGGGDSPGFSGTMVAKQPDPLVVGSPPGTNSQTNAACTFNQMSLTCRLVRDLAPVINAKFAVNYVNVASSTNVRYCFPSHNGNPISAASPTNMVPKTRTYFLSTGIDCCVSLYGGPSYTSEVFPSETISPGFYIFATTSYPPNTTSRPISVTFVTADTAMTSITVIGEGRSITPSSAGTFSDTFAFPWTVHIYKVNH